ncbi:MAG: DUF2330 domain-containing protein [Roseiarcus sp.]
MTSPVLARLKVGLALLAMLAQVGAGPAAAFCGFYVAQADSKLFNKSSKVVLARDGEETAITMASDYEGDAKQFALVAPVPTFIDRKQIGVVDMRTIDHLDAYSAPRLVEYFDRDPCEPPQAFFTMAGGGGFPTKKSARAAPANGVTVEANYDVGEYDVSILSATQSDGLVEWLTGNGYKIPAGAGAVLGSYIKQNMHFFVAKVNLDRMKLIGAGYLRPLQVRYRSAKFMLPLRLGTLNAQGPQDMIVFALTRNGRLEAANYPNVKAPSGMDVPLYVKDAFGPFYKAAFDRVVAQQSMRAAFVEYAWNMGNCDPCAAAPLAPEELVELGARWTAAEESPPPAPGLAPVAPGPPSRRLIWGGVPAFLTRLHIRYDRQSFPEDIAFLETGDQQSFQARYVLRHPWTGKATCPAAQAYRDGLPAAFSQQAETLVALTGWPRAEVEARMAATGQPPAPH